MIHVLLAQVFVLITLCAVVVSITRQMKLDNQSQKELRNPFSDLGPVKRKRYE